MNNSSSLFTKKHIPKIILIVAVALALVGLIGYSTVAILKSLKAPTISRSQGKSASSPAATPVQTKATADAAMASALDKATQGKQKDALADYQTAYDGYKATGNTAKANDALFAINSIKSVLAAEQSTAKPTGGKTSSKQ